MFEKTASATRYYFITPREAVDARLPPRRPERAGQRQLSWGKMLKISAYITLIWLALAVCRYAAAKEEDACFADEHPALQTVILAITSNWPRCPVIFVKSVESGQHTEIRHYRLMSQSRSPQDAIRPTQWWHDVDIYIPNGAFTGKALLVMSEDCACSAAGRERRAIKTGVFRRGAGGAEQNSGGGGQSAALPVHGIPK